MIKNTFIVDKTNTNNNYNTYDNYSEDLTSLILSSVIAKNSSMQQQKPKKKSLFSFVFNNKPAKTTKPIKEIGLLEAINYLANDYRPDNYCGDYTKIKLSDGTIIRIFGDDEVQINDTLLSLDDSAAILKLLKPSTQKLIIDFVINFKF